MTDDLVTFWKWLSQEDNRATVGVIGTGIGAVAVAVWVVCNRLLERSRIDFARATSNANKDTEQLPTLASNNAPTTLVLGTESYQISNYQEFLNYSFSREPYITPLVIRELSGWISDPNAVVVAVNVGVANRSNRMFGEYSVETHDGATWIQAVVRGGDQSPEVFAYRHIGMSNSGIHILHCVESGGGSGIFHEIMLVAFQTDTAVVHSGGRLASQPRILLKAMGSISLGDRYAGEISFAGGVLKISEDKSSKRFGGRTSPEQLRLE